MLDPKEFEPLSLYIAAGDACNQYALEGDNPSAPLAPEPGADLAFRLESGETYGFERKRLDNLLTSVRSGELADQIARMARWYDAVYIVVEHDYMPRVHHQRNKFDIVLPDDVMLDLVEYQELGLRLMLTENVFGTVYCVRSLMWRLHEGLKAPFRYHRLPKTTANAGLENLTWVVGIGPVKARALVTALGSGSDVLRYFLNTPEEEAIKRFGKEVTRKMRKGLDI